MLKKILQNAPLISMGRSQVRHFSLIGLFAALALTGCVDLTGRSAAQLSPLRAAEHQHFARAGHVYCILGWLGIWSRGMDVVAQRVENELSIDATSLANQEWRKLAAFLVNERKAGRWDGPLDRKSVV